VQNFFRIFRIENMISRVENRMSRLMIRRNELTADMLQLIEDQSEKLPPLESSSLRRTRSCWKAHRRRTTCADATSLLERRDCSCAC
jgi:hypothetical protein